MRTIVALAAVLFIGGCTLQDGAAPALTGPSEYALSVTLSASPDQLPRDGSSQAVVTVTVRDASARPVPGQRLSVFVPIGTVTDSEVVTGSDGRASFSYTAPPAGTLGPNATIRVIPVGGDARNDAPRTLVIGFTGAPNLRAPKAFFETTPEEGKIEVNQSVRFDASKTTDEDDSACLDCTYQWDFGDGATAIGRIVDHTFTVARPYTVTLTVTDAAGTTASTVKTLSVAAVDPPEVTLEVAPSEKQYVNQQVVFTAKATPAKGHSIQRYEWEFGDGTTQVTTTPTVAKTYTTVGIYVATVAAFDDLGQAGRAAKNVTVEYAIDKPVANFTISPSSPTVGVDVTFNGSSSTVGAGASIVSYLWDFGDNSAQQDTGTTPTVTKSGGYASASTYVVTLTITDSLGRQNTKTASLTVN